jgi:hypothetical protein
LPVFDLFGLENWKVAGTSPVLGSSKLRHDVENLACLPKPKSDYRIFNSLVGETDPYPTHHIMLLCAFVWVATQGGNTNEKVVLADATSYTVSKRIWASCSIVGISDRVQLELE